MYRDEYFYEIIYVGLDKGQDCSSKPAKPFKGNKTLAAS